MFLSYLKIALKVLVRRKFFTFISLFGIALTLTVLMVATAILDHMFGPHAPQTRPERTLIIQRLDVKGEHNHYGGEPGYQFLERYALGLPGVEVSSIFSNASRVAAFRDGRKIPLNLKRTDGYFWQILEFEFLEGAPFSQEDEEAGVNVAVISRRTREKLFDGGPAEGRTVTVDGQSFRVVGVVEDISKLRAIPAADVWVPHSTAKSSAYLRSFLGGFGALLLVRDPEDIPSVQAEFASRLSTAELPEPYTKAYCFAETLFDTWARDFFDQSTEPGSYATAFRVVIAGAMILFMVLPSVNLININTSRILERASEIGVRKAFGASAATLVGQFVVENVLLTLCGGVAGWICSAALLSLLSDTALLTHAHFTLNVRIFAYALLITLFFGLFSGVVPAWKMSRLHPVQALAGRN